MIEGQVHGTRQSAAGRSMERRGPGIPSLQLVHQAHGNTLAQRKSQKRQEREEEAGSG